MMLFAIAELLKWLAGLGSWQPTGGWLILGGMGLAALSNAAHLSKILVAKPATEDAIEGTEPASQQAVSEPQKATGSHQPVAQVSAVPTDSDSISFKIRPLKR